MTHQITIDPRYCGPEGVGNGGYVSGLLASHFDRPVEVTLRKPPYAGRPLDLEWFEDVLLLCDGSEVVATAIPTAVRVDVPAPPTYPEAVDASHVLTAEEHPFPNCFVCGPMRAGDDEGLRIFPGSLNGGAMVASPWIPAAPLGDKTGVVRPEFVFAALDCPGCFAAMAGEAPRPAVLGRFAVVVEGPIYVGERYVVTGWKIGRFGRKHTVGTAIFTEDGDRRGTARATWIELSANASRAA
jgi:hypothetical protein